MMSEKEKNDILSEFYELCGDMYLGKAKKEDIERITKSMVDSGQTKVMKEEFNKMTEVLTG